MSWTAELISVRSIPNSTDITNYTQQLHFRCHFTIGSHDSVEVPMSSIAQGVHLKWQDSESCFLPVSSQDKGDQLRFHIDFCFIISSGCSPLVASWWKLPAGIWYGFVLFFFIVFWTWAENAFCGTCLGEQMNVLELICWDSWCSSQQFWWYLDISGINAKKYR